MDFFYHLTPFSGILAVHGVLDGRSRLTEDRGRVRVPFHHLTLGLKPCKLPSVRDRGEGLPHEDGEHADPDDPAGDADDHPEVVRLVVHRTHRLLLLLLHVQEHLLRTILAPGFKLIRKAVLAVGGVPVGAIDPVPGHLLHHHLPVLPRHCAAVLHALGRTCVHPSLALHTMPEAFALIWTNGAY